MVCKVTVATQVGQGEMVAFTPSGAKSPIVGRRRVESVVLENSITQRRWQAAVDTVVFSGDWIPDHELAR